MITTSAPAKLFPLPLTPFEYYYWCDNRPDYPTTFPIELRFTGRLRDEPFSRALAGAVDRHPLLGSLIASGPDGQPVWVGGDGRPPCLDWAPEGVPISHPDGLRIDLQTVPGLRVWVRDGEVSTRVLLQFHHCCCDGLGALRFLEDLLVLYHREASGDPSVVPRPVDVEQLRARGDFPATEGGLRVLLRDWYVGARIWGAIGLRSPAPLSVPGGAAGDATSIPFLGFETHVLEPAQARRLRAAAGSRGVTLNDLLLGSLFQTIVAWNREHGARGNPWLRINMPATVRDKDDQAMPAANLLSFTFLARRANQCRDEAGLLAGIQQETEAIKRWRLGWYFLGGLAMFRGVPGMIPWFLNRNRSFATAVLSNLGRMFARVPLPRQGRQYVCGEAVLTRITGVPPIRPLTRAAIAVGTYADETTINLHCDPRLFTVESSRQFLSQYVERLLECGDLSPLS